MTDGPGTSGPRVGLLFDSVSDNTGDAAIGIAVRQELARHGITDARVVDPLGRSPSDLDALVVGGGELIRPRGDEFYDHFRVPGATMLNAVGVWEGAQGLDYLRDYAIVSARSTVEAARLARYVDRVDVLPCTTTTLQSEPVTIDGLDHDEPVVGVHLVPHTLRLCPQVVEVINALPMRKVLIPFTHYNFDASFMAALPIEGDVIQLPRMTPLELHSVIGQMSFVVVSSLHASIFAFSQGVPFASAYQEKVANYFGDRGLGDLVFRDQDALKAALGRIRDGDVALDGPAERDRAAVREAFADLAVRAKGLAGTGGVQVPPTGPEVPARRMELLLAQRAQVIVDRDRLMAGVVRRAQAAEGGEALWHAEADRLAGERAGVVAEREALLAERDALVVETDALRRRFERSLGQRLARLVQWILRSFR